MDTNPLLGIDSEGFVISSCSQHEESATSDQCLCIMYHYQTLRADIAL
jgi:hypothetical protein